VDTLQYDWCAAGAWKDPDLPGLGRDASSADEYRAFVGLWTVLAAPLIAGNDMRNMDAVTRGILTNRQVLGVHQDELGRPGRRLHREGDLDIWVRPLSDGGWVILLYNRGETELPAKLEWTELGLPPRGSLLLRDLWTSRNIGRERGGYATTLAPHTSQLLRAIP
jgi:alpha-galactosidase